MSGASATPQGTSVVRAILLMVLSMALMALGDATLKLATQLASQGQVMLMLSVGGSGLFLCVSLFIRSDISLQHLREPMVLLRSGLEVLAAIGMITAISRIDLSVLAAILQTTPLLVTVGAALFLGEKVGWRRWAAIAVGIVGMLIVIRPFGASFTGWEIAAVVGASGLAARDLVTRKAPDTVSTLALSTWGFIATIIPGLLLMAVSDRPVVWSTEIVLIMGVSVLTIAIGYLAITSAMRMAPASVVSPFRYSRLVFTTGLGMLIFGERPDVWTYFGAALILAAGLYSLFRERRLAKAAA